jgi:thiamine biosynthesis lipoprotein
MGTFAGVSVPGRDRERLKKYAARVREVFGELDATLSSYKPGSDISRINRAAGASPVPVAASTREMLEITSRYVDLTGGAFDPTLAPLIRLWGFSGGGKPEGLPGEEAIAAALRSVGYDHLVLANGTAYLDRPGMAVDLGGIAKGYAVDVAYRRLEELGAADAMVDLGGNIRCRGLARGEKPWSVGVRNPFARERILGTLLLTGGMAVATSGNYEQFFVIGGERYAHIIDPRSGYPVQGMAGVTVISKSAVEADAMSTALFVLGPRRSRPLLARLPDCHALFVPDRLPIEILITPGFKRFFTPRGEYASRVRDLGG